MDFLNRETAFLQYLQSLHNPLLDKIMVLITHLGDSGLIWIITALVLLCIKKYRKDGLVMGLALVFGLILGNLILKNVIQRPRPCWVDPSVLLLIANPTDYSFPSGHTQAAVAAAVVLWHADRQWGIAAAILAVGIAFSRMYLYVHYPTDILGGIVSGALCAGAALWCGEHLSILKKME